MNNPEQAAHKINNQETTKLNGIQFEVVPSEEYKVTYNNYTIITEKITPEKLSQYKQTTNLYEQWKNGEDLPDIGNWNNLYGDPYWRNKEHSLQFRIAGVPRRPNKKQIKSPEYFNPNCLKTYYKTKDSAIFALLLTLIRHHPEKVGYTHHYQRSIIKQLQEIHGIGEQKAHLLYNRGVQNYKDIKKYSNVIPSNHRSKALEQINNKIENNITLLNETNFLDNYGIQHIANKI